MIGGEAADSPVDRSNTTNIRMEAMALLTAMADANGAPCQITTDSEFWINVLTQMGTHLAAQRLEEKDWPN